MPSSLWQSFMPNGFMNTFTTVIFAFSIFSCAYFSCFKKRRQGKSEKTDEKKNILTKQQKEIFRKRVEWTHIHRRRRWVAQSTWLRLLSQLWTRKFCCSNITNILSVKILFVVFFGAVFLCWSSSFVSGNIITRNDEKKVNFNYCLKMVGKVMEEKWNTN